MQYRAFLFYENIVTVIEELKMKISVEICVFD